MFIQIQNTMDQSSVMKKLPQPHKVARTSKGCLFSGMHMTLKGWLGRKWLVLILVGLQATGCRHLVLGPISPERQGQTRASRGATGSKLETPSTGANCTHGYRPTRMEFGDLCAWVWRPCDQGLQSAPRLQDSATRLGDPHALV